MTTIYGPVPSRRLGLSLGIDPIPLKTCNWNCVYCQLGRSTPLVNERREWIPTAAIMEELAAVLANAPPDSIDWITFVGSGEPTLHSGLGEMMRQVKQMTALPVGLITNGALFYRPEVRRDVLAADAIMPTLSAGSAELHHLLHRHHPDVSFACHVAGLIALRREFTGQLWLELMLIAGMNDTVAALTDIARIVAQIKPDEIHITLPTRPPAETWVAPPEEEALMQATAILGEVARVVHPLVGTFQLAVNGDLCAAIADLVQRHPLSEAQVDALLAAHSAESLAVVKQRCLDSGRIRCIERFRITFWIAAAAHYPNTLHSERTRPVTLEMQGGA